MPVSPIDVLVIDESEDSEYEPERAHDERVEHHLARVQQVTDGDLCLESGGRGHGLPTDTQHSTDRPPNATEQRPIQCRLLQLGRLDLQRMQRLCRKK